MKDLNWHELPAFFPGMQTWGAVKGNTRFIITHDTACAPSKFLNRYAISVRRDGDTESKPLGIYDTFDEAKVAAKGALS